MKRISVNLTPAQDAALKKRAADTGVLQSEQIRRAIDAALATSENVQRPAVTRPAQPVLIPGK